MIFIYVFEWLHWEHMNKEELSENRSEDHNEDTQHLLTFSPTHYIQISFKVDIQWVQTSLPPAPKLNLPQGQAPGFIHDWLTIYDPPIYLTNYNYVDH